MSYEINRTGMIIFKSFFFSNYDSIWDNLEVFKNPA